MGLRGRVIEAGFGVLGAARLHRLAAPALRGLGAVLMFHHVRPPRAGDGFAPNGGLSITPAFLDATLTHLASRGYRVVGLDDLLAALASGRKPDRPLAVLTFDDGYRDNRDFALPVLERHGAPATFYVTTGFAARTARLWWVELERAIRRADRVAVTAAGETLDLPARTAAEKRAAWDALYRRLRAGPEDDLLDTVARLRDAGGVDGRALVEADCLDWDELVRFAAHPLVTVGAHTLTHPRLAKLAEADARRELAGGKAELEEKLGRPVRHLAYPVGDPTSAGPRDFTLAAECGYASAVTTRPGVIFPEHRDHLLALPRLSVNGDHQDVRSLDVLLSGVAFALWNRGRRLNVA